VPEVIVTMSMSLDGHAFHLSGGRLALDFANTRSRMSGEHLPSYRALVAFAVQTGQVDEAVAGQLVGASEAEAAAGAAVLARAHALRAAIFNLAAAAVRSEAGTPSALAAMNAELARSLAHARVRPLADGYAWGWDEAVALDRPLWAIARDAADLLADRGRLARVRVCAADDCDWLFVDDSTNHSRRWCDMRVCGNRAKARRFHQRRRLPAGS
jgi:predicted RNA-binding Zn ribbon-like protein